MSVLAAIAVLALLIFVHELGHFAAARLQHIRANRFSIGFGPVLLKYQGSETEYAIRAFPLGGYVGFPDDDPDSNIPPNDPDLLRNRPIVDRAIVISAGVIANLIFAYFLLVSQAAILGTPEFSYQPGVVVTQIIAENSPAAKANLQPGDIIVAIADRQLEASQETPVLFKQMVERSAERPLALEILRDRQPLSLTLTPEADPEGKGRIGIGLAPNRKVARRHPQNLLAALGTGAEQFQTLTVAIVRGFGQLLSNFGETAEQVSGPVAIVGMGAQIARSDAGSLFQFGALISINLAIINILPLPALDGGQLAFLLIEGLRGKPLPSRIQDGIMQTGLVLLLGLGMFLIVRDTANLLFQ